MIHGRIETTPSEQLTALRKARDHYVALAERLRKDTDPPKASDDDLARERDVRRIANAYEKSVANMMAKMARMGEPHDHASLFNSLGMARPPFAAFVGGAALFALIFFGIYSIGGRHPASRPAAPPAVQAIARQAPSTPSATRTAPEMPVAAAAGRPDASARASALRPTPATAQVRSQKSRATNRSPGVSNRAEDGFVAKVLQPDGSLKDVYFPAPR